MIVKVNKLGTIEPDKVLEIHYIELDDDLTEVMAMKMAFLYINRRKEKDYSELANNTFILKIERIEAAVLRYLRGE